MKVGQWIHQICQRNPEIIQVSYSFLEWDLCFQLPTCILRTQSLVQLYLNGLFTFNDDDDDDDGLFIDSINLPNLKKLSLYLHDSHVSLFDTLLKSCPLLEHLNLTMYEADDEVCVDISAPNLKFLFIGVDVKDGWLSNDDSFVINAPMLEQCWISGYLMSFDFIHRPTNLQRVRLSIQDSVFDSGNDYVSKILGLFQGISCARYLILEHWNISLLRLLSEVSLPNFNKLINLEISQRRDDQDWNPYPFLPMFLLSNLERLTIHIVIENELEIEMIKDSLNKAIVMKQLHVSKSTLWAYDDILDEETLFWREYKLCKNIFRLSEGSISCDIKFTGDAIIASREDFKNGLLVKLGIIKTK